MHQYLIQALAPLYKRNITITQKPYFPQSNQLGSSLLQERRVFMKSKQQQKYSTNTKSPISFQERPQDCGVVILHPVLRKNRQFKVTSVGSYKFRGVECRQLIKL